MKKAVLNLGFILCLLPLIALAGVKAGDVEKVISEAETLRKEAASLGFEWRDTKKQIAKASQLLKEGKLDKAMKVAKHARLESDRAIKQAKHEETHWKENLPK